MNRFWRAGLVFVAAISLLLFGVYFYESHRVDGILVGPARPLESTQTVPIAPGSPSTAPAVPVPPSVVRIGPSASASLRSEVSSSPLAGSSGSIAKVTKYCATGYKTYFGRDPAIGIVATKVAFPYGTRVVISGMGAFIVGDKEPSYGSSDYDIYEGGDPGCRKRALRFGIQRLRVEVG